MATSGTYVTLDVTQIIEEAYERIGRDVQALNAGHMRTARTSMQMIFSGWSNTGARVWELEEESYTCVDGTATFYAPSNTVDVLDAIITVNAADVPLTRIARIDYQAIPDKTNQGKPDRFWCDRSVEPFPITLYPVPNSATYTITYWRIRRLYDVTAGQQTPDVPFRWIDALTASLALRLFDKLPLAERMANMAVRSTLKEDAAMSFKLATEEDQDRATTSIVPAYYGDC